MVKQRVRLREHDLEEEGAGAVHRLTVALVAVEEVQSMLVEVEAAVVDLLQRAVVERGDLRLVVEAVAEADRLPLWAGVEAAAEVRLPEMPRSLLLAEEVELDLVLAAEAGQSRMAHGCLRTLEERQTYGRSFRHQEVS